MVRTRRGCTGKKRPRRVRVEPVARMLAAILLTIVAFAGLIAPSAAAPAVVTGATISRASPITRVALDLSDQVAFNVFTLPDPYRLVIDLPDVNWQARALADAVGGPCGTVRYGEVRPGTWRVVLECSAPATLREAHLQKSDDGAGYRLVVDLAPGGSNGVLGYMASDVERSEPRRAAATATGPAPLSLSAAQVASVAPSAVAAADPSSAWSGIEAGAVSPAAAPRSLIGESDRSVGGPVMVPARPEPDTAAGRNPTAASTAAQSAGIGATTLTLPTPPRRPDAPHAPRVIVLDAGHGGADPGAIGISGIYEKNITLAAVREIKRELEQTGRYKVFLTRDDDRFIRLRDRVDFARRVNAELFVSIHADSVSRRAIRGASVYTLSKTASDSEAAELADKENKADLIAGIDLSRESAEVTNILIDLAQRETMNQSAEFAGHLVRQLSSATSLLPNPHRFAGFAVLKAPDIPSVLIELGFLSNRYDERLLRQRENRLQVAAAVARAIDDYLTVTVSASAW